jgi:hypothetical protein
VSEGKRALLVVGERAQLVVARGEEVLMMELWAI